MNYSIERMADHHIANASAPDGHPISMRVVFRRPDDRIGEFYLKADGAFVDIYPLWHALGGKKAGKFMSLCEYRRRYLAAVEAKIGEPAIRVTKKTYVGGRAARDDPDNKKRYFYHQLLIKLLLYFLGIRVLDDFGPIISRLFGLSELPMLPEYQFDCIHQWVGIRQVVLVRRRHDSWINLTECMRGAGVPVANIAKSKVTLMRQLEGAGNAVAIGFDQLAEKYISTENGYETWVEPNVFMATIMDIDIEFHRQVTRVMLDNLFRPIAKLPSQVIDTELAPIAKPRCPSALARIYKA